MNTLTGGAPAPGTPTADLLNDALAGLTAPQKTLPCKYFYDERGSALFDRICTLPEYYPTRAEQAILERDGAAIAAAIGPRARLVELGSGSSVKTRLLLDRLDHPAAYVPVDISRTHMLQSAKKLAAEYQDLPILPLCADYTRPLVLPDVPGAWRTAFFYPGSTVGNFTPPEAELFLRRLVRSGLRDPVLVIGVDREKDPAVLEAAYDDPGGVTAEFNLNLIARLNRELGADFDLEQFRHAARYDVERHRIEMYLVSRIAQTVRVGGVSIRFGAGEAILTELSHKYTPERFEALASRAGWAPAARFTDPEARFDVHVLVPH